MWPAMLLPMVSTMSHVALPIVRDDLALQVDVAAWVDVGFALPFMLLMPVYGRLGDGLGPRRLLMVGMALFALGSTLVITAADLTWLLAGRALQGFGLAGMIPLGMALITSLFPPEVRGRTLGTWSTIGPATAFFSPLIAGVLVASWGWRGAFVPSLLCSLLALIVVYKFIPEQEQKVEAGFLRAFDWGGVALLALGMTCLIFFLSSRPITGVEPLQDWRLLVVGLLFLVSFFWWEKRRALPFIPLGLFKRSAFMRGSFCASMRMVAMGGTGFLVPLYLVDIQQIKPVELGGMLMIGAGAMTLVVRLAGTLADRWSSRWLIVLGLMMQIAVMLAFWQLPSETSLWSIGLVLGAHGLGAGVMLATLHKMVISDVEERDTGAAAGLYSMFRFLGAAIGTALSGVLLQNYLDQNVPVIEAYQQAFLAIAAFPLLGLLVAFSLRDEGKKE